MSRVRQFIGDELERIAREGVQRLLAEMLELEVSAFVQRARDQRGEEHRGDRTGYAPERTIGVGLGAVSVRVPRVSDVPPEVAPNGFHSQIVRRDPRVSRATQRTLLRLSLEGLSAGDFEPVFRTILGETAPLSASSVSRLKEQGPAESEVWAKRSVAEQRSLSVWVDGVSREAGQEDEQTALLVVRGLRADGKKELLGLGLGDRERSASWAPVLRDLRDRGRERPVLVIGDGVLGIWAALRELWPQSRRPRCWHHQICNVLDQLPKRLWGQIRTDLRPAIASSTRAACRQRLEGIAADLRAAG